MSSLKVSPGTPVALLETSRALKPEQRLLVAILALVIQDLGLSKHFPDLKEYFVVLPSSPINKASTETALKYLLSKDTQTSFCFSQVCSHLHLEPVGVRKIIIATIKKEKNNPAYKMWRNRQ